MKLSNYNVVAFRVWAAWNVPWLRQTHLRLSEVSDRIAMSLSDSIDDATLRRLPP